MRTFQHIRLHTHKGLKGTTLHDLQKINVICGPNNSGKTTVLECLADSKLCTIGLTFSGDAAKSVATESAHGFGWGEGNRHLDNTFMQLVEQAVASRPVWFADEIEQLFGLINWRQHFGNWATPDGNLQHVLTTKFSNSVQPFVVLRQSFVLADQGLKVRSCRAAENWPVSQEFNDLFVSNTG